MADHSDYLMREDYCRHICHKPGRRFVFHLMPCCKKCEHCGRQIKKERHSDHEERCRDRRVRVVKLEGQLLYKADYSDVYFGLTPIY